MTKRDSVAPTKAKSSGRKTQEILTLIDALRERGVVHFKEGDLELVLGPVPEPEEGDKEVDNAPKTGGKVGKDGYNAAQQREVYGVVMDAEE